MILIYYLYNIIICIIIVWKVRMYRNLGIQFQYMMWTVAGQVKQGLQWPYSDPDNHTGNHSWNMFTN